MPDLGHLARLRGGPTSPATSSALDEVECVERRLGLGSQEQVRERFLLRAIALLEAPGRGAFDQVERPVRRRCGSVERVVELPSPFRDRLCEIRKVVFLAKRLLRRDGHRLVDQPLRLDDAVDEAELVRLCRVQHLVLAHRVEGDQLHGRLGTCDSGSELRRAPGGDEPEQAFGRREVTNVLCDHPVVAVERKFDAASQDAAVDRRDRWVRKRADAPKEVMTRAAALDRLLAPLDARELLHVGAAGEAPRLAGDHERREVALLELRQEASQRLECRAPEDVRPAGPRTVVHRHEGDGVDAIQRELGHGLGHGRRLSSEP